MLLKNIICIVLVIILNISVGIHKFENERSTNSESDFSDNSSHCGGECDRTEVILPRKAFPRKPIETSPPSFDHRSVGFQSASEDPVQTCNSPPAFSREAEFSFLEFSSS